MTSFGVSHTSLRADLHGSVEASQTNITRSWRRASLHADLHGSVEASTSPTMFCSSTASLPRLRRQAFPAKARRISLVTDRTSARCGANYRKLPLQTRSARFAQERHRLGWSITARFSVSGSCDAYSCLIICSLVELCGR